MGSFVRVHKDSSGIILCFRSNLAGGATDAEGQLLPHVELVAGVGISL